MRKCLFKLMLALFACLAFIARPVAAASLASVNGIALGDYFCQIKFYRFSERTGNGTAASLDSYRTRYVCERPAMAVLIDDEGKIEQIIGWSYSTLFLPDGETAMERELRCGEHTKMIARLLGKAAKITREENYRGCGRTLVQYVYPVAGGTLTISAFDTAIESFDLRANKVKMPLSAHS